MASAAGGTQHQRRPSLVSVAGDDCFSSRSEPATPHSTGSQDGELPQTSFSDPLILSPLWSSSPPSAVTSLSDSGPLAPLRGGELTAFKAPLKLSLDKQPPLKQPFPSYSTDSLSPCRLDSGFKKVSAHIASASHPELAQESSLQRHQRSASHEPIADASARRSTEAEERDDTPAGSLFSGDDSDLTDEEDPDATDDASAALTDEGHRPRNSQSAKWPLAEGAFEWDKAQNDLLLSSVKKHGRNWIAVAADMAAAGAPKRTGNALKARYNRMCAAVKGSASVGQVTPLRTASLPQLMTGTSTRITSGSSALASSSRDQPIPLTGPLPGPRKRRRLEQHSWTEKEKDALRGIADKHAQLPYKAKEKAFFRNFAALFPTTAKKLSPRFVFNYYNDSLRTPVGSRPLISGTSESNSGQAASTSQQRALPAQEPEPHGNGFKFTNEELAFLRTIRPKSEGVPKSRWSLGSGVHRAFKERFPDTTRSDASVRTKYLQLMDQGQLLGESERVEEGQASRRKNVTGPGLTEQQARALLAKQPMAGQNISLGTTKASDVNDRQRGVVNNDPMANTTLLSRQGILGATVGTAGAPSSPIQRPVHSAQGSSSPINFSIHVEDQVIMLSNCPPGLGVAVYSPTSIRFLGRQQMLDLSRASEQPAFAFRISEDESRSVQLVNWPQGTSTSMAIVTGSTAAEAGKAGVSGRLNKQTSVVGPDGFTVKFISSC